MVKTVKTPPKVEFKFGFLFIVNSNFDPYMSNLLSNIINLMKFILK